jgi:glycosyltransferase involved in cell wall biosynthesis
MIVFISPFSEAGASTNRLVELAGAYKDKKLILPKRDKYGTSTDAEWFYFPIEVKSFKALPIWWVRTTAALLKWKPGAVVFLKPHLFTLPPALVYRMLSGRPVVFDCDEWDPATLEDNDEPGWKVRLTEILAAVGFRFSDLIVYANHLTKDEKIPAKYHSKTAYIPNGVDTKAFKPATEKHEGFNVMYVGMLYKIRHILPIVDAVEKAGKSIGGLTCTIVGGGDKLEVLKKLVSARGLGGSFRFTGMVSHDSLPKLIGGADVLVAPFEEMKGIRYQSNVKVFEYMACGKPVVATRVGELDRVLEGCGVIVPPGDSSALAKAIVGIRADAKSSSEMGRNARRKAEAEYDWKILAERLKGSIAALGVKT